MSLISLKHWIPERGESNLKDEKQALEGLEKFKPEVPKRETPEKQLQAWIINQVIFGEVPSFWDKYNLTFLTSELRIEEEANKFFVNDILAIDDKGQIWVIELKSSRDLSILIGQVDAFKGIINQNKETFHRLVNILIVP